MRTRKKSPTALTNSLNLRESEKRARKPNPKIKKGDKTIKIFTSFWDPNQKGLLGRGTRRRGPTKPPPFWNLANTIMDKGENEKIRPNLLSFNGVASTSELYVLEIKSGDIERGAATLV